MICKMTIQIDDEEYVKVQHYKKGEELLSKGWYHIKCYRERLNGNPYQNALQLKTLGILNKLGEKI